jgi:hypothetical protein
MTTLDIGTLVIHNPNVQNKSMEEIKAFLTKALENDFMTKRKKGKFSDVEQKLKNLKVTNPNGGKNLEEAFNSLNKKLKAFQDIDIEKSKEEYLNKKYAI